MNALTKKTITPLLLLLDKRGGGDQFYGMAQSFISITQKITAILLLSLIVGIGMVVLYFAYGQNRTLHLSTERNLFQQADILHQSIKNAMLPGEAPLVVSLFNDIRTIGPMYEIKLYRRDGVAAFSDNSTLELVNSTLGMRQFAPKTIFLQGPPIPPEDPPFYRSVTLGKTEAVRNSAQDRALLTIYKPLLNLPKCTSCHGSDHTIRGVLAIEADMTPIFAQARTNILIAVAIFIGIVMSVFLMLSSFLRRAVIRPIQCIGHVAAEVTRGNFHEKVRTTARDEIGTLGRKMNTMVEGLYERFELSKYVSSSTLDSIKHSERGTKTDIALFFSDIRGFTSFSEQVEPEIVVEHLNHILTLQTDIIHRHGGDIDKYVGDEIVALFTGDRKEDRACLSALEIQASLASHETEFARLQVGIGINTGEVVLGRIGSEKRADFTVIGDHVNFASRLCSEAAGGAVLISEATFQAVQTQAEVQGPFELKVKGKARPQKVYHLQGFDQVNSDT